MSTQNMNHLLPLELNDLPPVRQWLCRESVYKYLYVLYHPMSMNDLEAWYKKEKDEGAHIFKYCPLPETMTGMGLVHYIHPKNRCGEISVIIDPEQQGRGHGGKLMRALFEYSFMILNLHKVFFHTTDFNGQVHSLTNHFPVHLEGTYRDELYHNGSYHNIMRYGILCSEFTEVMDPKK